MENLISFLDKQETIVFYRYITRTLPGQAIEKVLGGAASYFELEYPCHSPTEERWFIMSVTPLVGNGQGAVVSHKNVTSIKKVEHGLQKALLEIEQLKDRLEQENVYLQQEIKLERNFEEIIGQSRHLR